MKTLVALDLETTGLDPERDAIIEIGAVKFKGERIEGTFSTLVNPGRPVGAFITRLTNINDAMLANQPRVTSVLPGLVDFVGNLPVLGHSVKFDLDFLQAAGALRHNEFLDTFDLASVLLTAAGRYSLAALGTALGVPLPASHRALDDARVTHAIFLRLFQLAHELPLQVLAEIVDQGHNVEWGGGWIFQEALALRSKEIVPPRKTSGDAGGPLFAGTRVEGASRPAWPGQDAPSALGKDVRRGMRVLTPNQELQPLDPDALGKTLVPDGPLARSFPGYEHRPQQIEMLKAVARAFSQGHHMMIEAATGIGKSLAYLIPAAEWALLNHERVVISTNTINLQDQLINKDVPDLRTALDLDFKAVVLKGRSNYLCPRRLESLRRRGPQNAEEMRTLAKVLVWLGNGRATGDRSELTLSGQGALAAWMRISAEDDQCTADTCMEKTGGACPFYKARRAAEAAHVVIINHALLMADVAAGNQVLPDFRYLVVDEAHHLEAAATDGLSFRSDRSEAERRLRELGGPRAGLLGGVLSACHDVLPPLPFGRLEREVERAYTGGTAALSLARGFFDGVGVFLADQRQGRPVGEYVQQVRVTQAIRNQPYWEQVEVDWHELRGVLGPLAETLSRLSAGLMELDEYDIPERDDLVSSLNSAARYYEGMVTNLDGLVSKPDPQMIYWCEVRQDGERVSLHAAPLHVGPLVEKHLWNTKASVVMTSATLTTGGEFDYLKGRLNAGETDELAVGTPFDYETSTLLYLVNDIPEPVDKHGFQHALDATLIPLCTATRGRVLVLFTAHYQLKQTSQAITDPLAQAGIIVFEQSDGASRSALLDSFKSAERAVLLGTKSFWEGVDVPGEGLSLLVIVKLPFDVPTNPIFAARSETFERAFNEYSIPEAVLRFRQGFGRLIRTRTDRGVVAVFDRRILTRQYGRHFLDSLPPCTVRRGPMAALPEKARRWIDEGRE